MGAKDRFELVDESHRNFPEWKDPGTSCLPLEIMDIVEALGLSEEESARVSFSIDTQPSRIQSGAITPVALHDLDDTALEIDVLPLQSQ